MCVTLCESGSEMEAAILSAGHFSWSNTEHTPQCLIALWVVGPAETIVLLMFMPVYRIRSIKVMQHRRRDCCELFSGGRLEIFSILQQWQGEKFGKRTLAHVQTSLPNQPIYSTASLI